MYTCTSTSSCRLIPIAKFIMASSSGIIPNKLESERERERVRREKIGRRKRRNDPVNMAIILSKPILPWNVT